MSDPAQALEELLALAFESAPAVEANQAITRVREQVFQREHDAWSYEVLLPAEDPMGYLRDQVLPRLVYFAECHGAKLPTCPGMFLSIFRGDRLHFLHADQFLAHLAGLTGLSFAQMVDRWGDRRP